LKENRKSWGVCYFELFKDIEDTNKFSKKANIWEMKFKSGII